MPDESGTLQNHAEESDRQKRSSRLWQQCRYNTAASVNREAHH